MSLKTLDEVARWMFINVVPAVPDTTYTEVLVDKRIDLKLTHEGFGQLPVVAGQFGNADIRISLNPPVKFRSKEIVILVNPAQGEFRNIRVGLDHDALTEALTELLHSTQI